MSLISITNLRIGYQNRRGDVVDILRGVDLSIAPGETLGLVGESGSGKSTLALALLGYLRRGSRLLNGAVTFDGISLFGQSPSQLTALRGARIALVPQDAGKALTPTMRVGSQIEEAIALHTDLGQAERRQWLLDLLHQVRLPDPERLAQRYPHELSGGQQQRVAIAMALAGRPAVLVLDEPTTGLDVTTQAHILTLLRELAQNLHMAMVYVSHDMGVIAQVSDRVAVMYAGEVVEDGPVAEVLLRPHHPYTRGLLASMPRVHFESLPQALPGAPPALDAPRVGCAFAPRCAWADGRCQTEDPALLQIDERDHRHAVRCHHWQQLDAWKVPLQLKPDSSSPQAATLRPLLRLEEVSLSYHSDRGIWRRLSRQPQPPSTVQDVSLTVQKGKTLALVGESGSGKSTLIRAIAGLLTPHKGTIYFDEAPLAANVDHRAADLQQRIQLIFQNPDSSLNPRHTVLDLLAQPLRLYHQLNEDAIRARAAELLALVRLGDHYLARYPAQLSGGEKQRVAVARVFAAEPDLVLCDEITSSLDVSVQAAVLSLLSELQSAREVTYLFISHDLAVVRAFADDVAVLYQGRLCEFGPASAVFAPPFHPYTATLIDATLEPEPGQLPQLADEPSRSSVSAHGCPFQARCPLNLGEICRTQTPPWQEAVGADGKTHQIRCHIPWQELAGQSEIRFQMPSQTEHVP